MVPSHLLQHWKPVQVKFRSPTCTLDRNGSEWNFQTKDWRIKKKKAQHTRLICCRIQCQTKHTSYAARPTILGVFSWLKFMWHLPSWAYEGSKYWSWTEFMYASLSEMNTRLLSYYQKKFLISFTFKHRKIKQHMPELHKPKYLAGNKIILKDRSNNIF